MIHLRPYQQRAIDQLRASLREGKKRIVLCAPTGAGKTVIFSAMAYSAIQKQKRVLIVTDRVELLNQSGGALNRLDLHAERIEAGNECRFDQLLYVAMIETLHRRLKDARYLKLLQSFDLIIFDEAHKQAFNKLFDHIPESVTVIGATATPYRDGNQTSMRDFYHTIVDAATVQELIDLEYLCQPRYYGAPIDLSDVKKRGNDYDADSLADMYSKNQVFAGVTENYLRITPGEKALVFCANIRSSLELCSNMLQAGIQAKHLDSTMTDHDRRKILTWFTSTPDAVLCNVGILTTGFDCPDVRVIILYRATQSLPLYMQMIGRGSRLAPGKDAFTVLDFGNNVKRHGLWEQERKWTLDKKKKKAGVAPMKDCPKCDTILAAVVIVCPECGHEWDRKEKEREEVFVQLRLLNPPQVRQVAMSKTLEERAEMCKAGLIKPFWVLHNLSSIEEAKAFTGYMGWKWAGWWHYNKHRFPNLARGLAGVE